MVVGVEELSDLLLLLVVLRELGQVVGRTRLQKIVYLLREMYQIPFRFRFKPYFYGPYSEDLSDAIENLTALGVIEEGRRYLAEGVIEYSYSLTRRGSSFLEGQITGEIARRPPLGASLAKALRELEALPTSTLVSSAKSMLSTSQMS